MGSTKYVSLHERIKSFASAENRVGFHNSELLRQGSIRKLADAGLYFVRHHTGIEVLRCYACNLSITNIVPEDFDTIWDYHASAMHFPHCIHVYYWKGIDYIQTCQNDTWGPRKIKRNANMSIDVGPEYVVRDVDVTLVQATQRLSMTGQTPIHEESLLPKAPGMMVKKDRLKTFGDQERFQEYAAAGLYCAQDGCVRCYWCGHFMKELKGDGNLDPWLEHAKISPNCLHIILQKGKLFVNEVGRRNRRRALPNERDESVIQIMLQKPDLVFNMFNNGSNTE